VTELAYVLVLGIT